MGQDGGTNTDQGINAYSLPREGLIGKRSLVREISTRGIIQAEGYSLRQWDQSLLAPLPLFRGRGVHVHHERKVRFRVKNRNSIDRVPPLCAAMLLFDACIIPRGFTLRRIIGTFYDFLY
jgi:hypothetical protein